jgi:hypothetical protein
MHLGSTHVSHASRHALQDRGGGPVTCSAIRQQDHLHSENMIEKGCRLGRCACATWRWRPGVIYRERWPGARAGSGARSAVVRRSSARVPEYKRQPRMTQSKRHAVGRRQIARPVQLERVEMALVGRG